MKTKRYKSLRNAITNDKRKAKERYYKNYFEQNKMKTSAIWKGIKSIVKIKAASRKDITLIDDNGVEVTKPFKIANIFNKYFVNIGPTLDKEIPNSNNDFKKYLSNIKVNKTFFLESTTPMKSLIL